MNSEYLDRVKKELKKQDTKKMTRYYFWDWCMGYGWRQGGSGDGYESIKELKESNEWAIKFNNVENWKILKAEIIESKKLSK